MLSLVREDLRTHGGRLTHPGFVALAHYRFGAWSAQLAVAPARAVGLKAYHLTREGVIAYSAVRLYYTARIGRGVRLEGGLISVHPDAVLGDRVTLRGGVTLGTNSGPGVPTLGAGVEVEEKSTVAGAVRVGAGARIAPNSLVTRNVPAGHVAVGVPARNYARAPWDP